MSDKSSELGEEYCRVDSPDVGNLEQDQEEERIRDEKFGEIALNQDDENEDDEGRKQPHHQHQHYGSNVAKTHAHLYKNVHAIYVIDFFFNFTNVQCMSAAAYQLGNTSSRTITEVKQR